MGGASSRFDQTQWWNADGGLMSSGAKSDGDQTGGKEKAPSQEFHPTILPNQIPTSCLEIFDILKSKSITSSRDFEVKDSNKNIVYVTRAVPGTMAWFDVLKPGISVESELALVEEGEEEGEGEGEADDANKDKKEENKETTDETTTNTNEEFLLRVQVDWNRRSWTIYTLTPVFPGQLPATLPSRKGLEEDCQLYKSCCLTLSWSKALAVVARYGPPTKLQDFLFDDDLGDESEQGGGDGSGHDSIAINGDEGESDFATDALFTKAGSIAAKSRKGHDVDVNAAMIEQLNQSQASLSSATPKAAENDEGGVMDSLAKSVKTFLDPALEQPKVHLTDEEKQRYALEGVVTLDAPLLQCQTVLGKKHHHQTRLVSKEEVVKLWVLDDAWNKERFLKQEDEDKTQGSTKSPLGKAVAYELSQMEKPHEVEELKKWFSNEYVDEDQRYLVKDDVKTAEDAKPSITLEDARNSLLSVGKSWFSFRAPQKSADGEESVAKQEEPSESTDAVESAETEAAPEQKEEPKSPRKPRVYGSNHGVLDSDDGADRKEPLVSHWQWKNTYTTRKMQMHLAKNSDLALHTVLSVVLNIW